MDALLTLFLLGAGTLRYTWAERDRLIAWLVKHPTYVPIRYGAIRQARQPIVSSHRPTLSDGRRWLLVGALASGKSIAARHLVTIQLKLLPTPTQAEALKQALLAANAACNQISHLAWHIKTFHQFALHKLAYRSLRQTFGLAAQLVGRCLAKVAAAYKLDRIRPCQFARLGTIPLDSRLLSFALADSSISLWTRAGHVERRRSKSLKIFVFPPMCGRGSPDILCP